MPCEFVPRTVNNTYIALELEVNKPEKRTMYEQKLELSRPITSGYSVERGRLHGRPQEECCQEDEKFNPKMFSKETRFQVFGYRTLPRVFSALGDFGVIQETESAIDDVCVSSERNSVPPLEQTLNLRRKSTANVTTKTKLDVSWFTSSPLPKNNHRRCSEGSLLVSAREDLRLGEYRNYSERILSDHRSERKDSIDISEQINNTGETGLLNGYSRRSSFTAMNTIPENLSDSQRFYSLPRKLSLPVENRRRTTNRNGKKQRNSFPENPSNSRTFALDEDTDVQWEMLVARAKDFQKLSSKEPPETAQSKVEETDEVKVRNEATGFNTKSVDQNCENVCDIETKENDESAEIFQENLYESSNNAEEIEDEGNSSIPDPLTVKEVAKSGQVDLTVKNVPMKHDFDPQVQVDKNSRRYSLAAVRPPQEVKEKISGYSTHGALEYAKMLLGKIQSEGKTKSKKERLDEMSKALKMVLEELNRIDLPDRELVSLFVSLRDKIFILKAELKAEEKHELTTNDKLHTENDVKDLSKTLPPRVRSNSESVITQPNFRRFSWC